MTTTITSVVRAPHRMTTTERTINMATPRSIHDHSNGNLPLGPVSTPIDLVRRAQLSDRLALNQLMETLFPFLVRYISKHAPSRLSPDDILGDTLLAVVSKLEDLQNPAKLQAWVLQIATRHISNAFRQEKHRQNLHERARMRAIDPCDQYRITQVQQHNSDTRTAVVGRILDILSPKQREVYVLRFLSDPPLKVHEIASRLSCKVDTVKSRLHSGRMRVKAIPPSRIWPPG